MEEQSEAVKTSCDLPAESNDDTTEVPSESMELLQIRLLGAVILTRLQRLRTGAVTEKRRGFAYIYWILDVKRTSPMFAASMM